MPSVAFGIAVALFAAIGLAEDLSGLSVGQRLVLAVLREHRCRLRAHQPVAGDAGQAGRPLRPLPSGSPGSSNAFNFMDGVNGISAAHALIRRRGLRVPRGVARGPVPVRRGQARSPRSHSAFLPWNAVRARVFLGDVGSYTLGAAVAVLAAYAVAHGVPVEAAIAPWPCTSRTRMDAAAAHPGGRALGSRGTARTPISACATWAGRTSGSLW